MYILVRNTNITIIHLYIYIYTHTYICVHTYICAYSQEYGDIWVWDELSNSQSHSPYNEQAGDTAGICREYNGMVGMQSLQYDSGKLVLAPNYIDLQSEKVKGENDNHKPWDETGYSTCQQNQAVLVTFLTTYRINGTVMGTR